MTVDEMPIKDFREARIAKKEVRKNDLKRVMRSRYLSTTSGAYLR